MTRWLFDLDGNTYHTTREWVAAIFAMLPDKYHAETVIEACANVIGAVVAGAVAESGDEATAIVRRIVDRVTAVAREELR